MCNFIYYSNCEYRTPKLNVVKYLLFLHKTTIFTKIKIMYTMEKIKAMQFTLEDNGSIKNAGSLYCPFPILY